MNQISNAKLSSQLAVSMFAIDTAQRSVPIGWSREQRLAANQSARLRRINTTQHPAPSENFSTAQFISQLHQRFRCSPVLQFKHKTIKMASTKRRLADVCGWRIIHCNCLSVIRVRSGGPIWSSASDEVVRAEDNTYLWRGERVCCE